MAKYSYELKKKIVDDYISGKGGYEYLANVNGISDKSIVRRWVKNYEKFGDRGLIHRSKNEVYSFEKKLSVVELYLSSEISYQKLALQEGITNFAVIVQWVSIYRKFGPEGLIPHKKGRKKAVEKFNEKPTLQPCNINTTGASANRIKELEDEVYKLRLENAFLKELRRLRLEDEAKTRERRVSSTASEDNSN